MIWGFSRREVSIMSVAIRQSSCPFHLQISWLGQQDSELHLMLPGQNACKVATDLLCYVLTAGGDREPDIVQMFPLCYVVTS